MDMRMELSKSVLTLSLILILFPLIGHSAERDLVDADGNGLIEIYDLSDLNEIRNNLDGKALYGSSQGCPDDGCVGFELKADLDFDTNGDGKIDAQDAYWNNSAGWLPIGDYSQSFTAVLNGNGHVIRNLYINRPSSDYQGLFGRTDGASISRVGLAGTLTQIIGRSRVGGLVGLGGNTKLQGVFSTGSVSSDYDSFTDMGGIVGFLHNNSLVEDSFSSANMSAKGSFVGGLVGELQQSTVKRVFSIGFVRSKSSTRIGGLVGRDYLNSISNGYWATDASGQSGSHDSSTSANFNYFGATLAQLRCATSASDTSCLENRTLFENWPTDAAANNGIAWVFSSDNSLPALQLNGTEYRDSDGDGFLDEDDAFPNHYAAAIDMDEDGHPDRWTLGCDTACQQSSGLTLDMFPETAAAWQDDDLDGLPDSWANGCDEDCQQESGLTLDTSLNDYFNGAPASSEVVDKDQNGLIEIETLEQLNAIRYNLAGTGLVLEQGGEINSEGCPARIVNGTMQRLCHGYELKVDLDFDTNGDGKIDASDAYWNDGAGWLPIGDGSQKFTAEFNGNGYVIRNLYINRPTTDYIGLFGYTDGASISRVGLAGTLTQIIGRSRVGGLVGQGKNTKLQGVFSTGSVSGDSGVGGMAGYLSKDSLIEDSFNSATVNAESITVGGLVGELTDSRAERAFSIGFVRSQSSIRVGGLVGYRPSSSVSDSYWAMDVSGQTGSDGSSTSANSNYFGATLVQLRCATSANDTSCLENRTLFENWPTDAAANNGIAWVFSNDNRLPALQLNGKRYRDSDGDGFLDEDDDLPNDFAASVDTDGDGYPDAWNDGCDAACQKDSGLVLDALPNHAAASVDTDGDGYPDAWNDGCDAACQENSGLVLDAFPDNAAASIDTDGDGYPDAWNEGCDIACQQNSGLILDEYLNDFDNDGVEDHLDPDLYADNGAPEMQSVPGEMHVPADETGIVALLKYSDLLADLRAFDAKDGYDVNFQAKIGANIVPFETIDDEKYLKVPVGRQVLAWHATDESGNESSAKEQMVNVYPHIRFVEEESIIGEKSTAKVAVSLTGESPVYPVLVELEFDLGKSTLTQDDVASHLQLSESQTLKFLAGETEKKVEIPVLDDDIAEEDEILLIKLLGVSEDTDKSEYFRLDPSYQQHELTVTERNLPPSVVLQLYQDDQMVEKVRPDGGEVRIVANITDPNGNDTHTISWKEEGGLPFLHTDGNVLTFDPSSLSSGSYEVTITVTDSGNPPSSVTKDITVEVLSLPESESSDDGDEIDNTDKQKEETTKKKKKKGGSVPVAVFAGLALVYAQRRWQKNRAAA